MRGKHAVLLLLLQSTILTTDITNQLQFPLILTLGCCLRIIPETVL